MTAAVRGFVRFGFAALGLLVLNACASFSDDGGFDRVQALVHERSGHTLVRPATADDAQTVAGEIARILSQRLGVEDAVRIALLNNRGLQANYAELGIAEADLVQAGRLRNPTFSFARLRRGDEIEYERTIMLPIMNLITMPVALRIERRRFEQAQLRAAAEALRVVDATRRAWFDAVAAHETVHYMERVNKAAAAGAELATRMTSVGNWSRLQHAREQAFYADTATELARARLAAARAREQLTRLMGLASDQVAYRLPERLPDLPAAPRNVGDAEALALQNRLDLLMAERELAGLSSSLGLTRATRFINLFDVGYLHNTSNEAPRETGYEIELQIPVFDWGDARIARAEALYMQAAHRAADIAVAARAEVRGAYASYRTAYDLARHYRDEIVPLRKRISEENQLRYNGMLIGVFELLADAREQYRAVVGYIEASRDHWMADSALQMALTGTSTRSVPSATAPLSASSMVPRNDAAH